MNRAARTVTTSLRQIQRLHHNALSCKRRIAMHQNRQDLRALLITPAVHTRLDRAFDDRIDDLEVRRIECQRQVHRATGRRNIA